MALTALDLRRDFNAEAAMSENRKLRRAVANQARHFRTKLAEKDRVIVKMAAELEAAVARTTTLEAQVAELVGHISRRGPKSSSTPPSAVPPHERHYVKRQPTGRPAGKPKGARGNAPVWEDNPEHTVIVRPEHCPAGHDLSGAPGTGGRATPGA